MSFTVGLLLLFCNIAWSINPAVGKVLVNEMGPGLTAWAKYAGILVTLLLFMARRPREVRNEIASPNLRLTKSWVLIFIMGVSAFFLAPLTQMTGLQTSSATSNSILVAMEPLLTLFLAWLILRTKPATGEALCLALAVAGFALIANFSWTGARGLSINKGDLFILAAVGCEALYAVLTQKLKKIPAEIILTAAIAFGFIFLSVFVLPHSDLAKFKTLDRRGLLSLLWAATLGGAVPYLIWTHVIKKGIPLAILVSSLFWQPLLGSLAGHLIHGEVMGTYQMVGGLLILSAVALQIYLEKRAPGRAKVRAKVAVKI